MSTVIGLDIGGTKIAAAKLRERVLGDTHTVATELASADALLDQLVEVVSTVRDGELDAVGIGVPSVVDFETGRVISSVNIPLTNVPLRAVLGRRLGVPVFVDNDATVAALAEAHDATLRRTANNLVMLTLGTGLGGGLVLGGRTYRGATGAAAELGHTLVAVDIRGEVPPPKSFPQPGSIESIASGTGLNALAKDFGFADGVVVVEAMLDGDASARRVVEQWASYVGIAVANAMNTFDPDEVVLGGGAARAGDVLLEKARTTALGYVLPGVGRRTTVRLARHGADAGVLGATLLAANELAGAGVSLGTV